MTTYYDLNKEKINNKCKEKYRENPQKYIEKVREYYKLNSEKIKEQKKQKRKEEVEKYRKYEDNRKTKPKRRYQRAKISASYSNISWNISYDEYLLLINTSCYYCNNNIGKIVTAGIGLDRLDSSIGYEINNIVSCCEPCNKIKNNILSSEEMKVAVAAILEYRKNHLNIRI